MKKIVITGGSGQIGYFLSFLVAKGEIFGPEQPISLHLLVKPEHLEKSRGIQMELEDCCFPGLKSVHFTSDPEMAFKQADLVFFAGAAICKDPSMRELVCKENWDSLAAQAEVLNRVAHTKTIVIVIANPANTNAYVLHKNAPNIPAANFHALVRLDEMRAKGFAGQKIIVWGNHSPTIVADGERELVEFVQGRGAAVAKARGASSCASAAWAAIGAAKALFKEGEVFSSGVYAKGNPYGIDEDLFFSFPCRSLGNGSYRLAEEIKPSLSVAEGILKSEIELIEEREIYLRK